MRMRATRFSPVCGKTSTWDALVRVEHTELEMERFLQHLPAGSPVALESSGNWYWLVRAMEEAGLDSCACQVLQI
jgi:hypothetical protein